MAEEKAAERLDMAAIRRRVEFVLNEARCGMKVRDKTLTFALRAISTYCSFDKDLNARDIKFKTKVMSQAALDRKRDNPNNWWRQAQTVNEHQEPLDKIWKDICVASGQMSVDEVIDRFKRYSMVVVTKEEDDRLRHLKHLSPEERYNQAGIIVRTLGDDGIWR